MVQTRLLTADDLLALGSDCHCELVEGRLVPLYDEEDPMSPAAHEHGEVAMEIGFRVKEFVRARRLGRTFAAETGFRLRRNPDTVRAPDFAFVAHGRITANLAISPYLDLAPDLVVEVLSPGDRAGEIARTVREYLVAGVRLVWIAYPALQVLVVHYPNGTSRSLSAEDELSGEDVLPGFVCRVSELFPSMLADSE
jgi:Uma2 family endonuclease